MAQANITKKRKFVADGVFYAELNEVNICDDSVVVIVVMTI